MVFFPPAPVGQRAVISQAAVNIRTGSHPVPTRRHHHQHPEAQALFLSPFHFDSEVRTTASMSRLAEEDATLASPVSISAGSEMQHSLLAHAARLRMALFIYLF